GRDDAAAAEAQYVPRVVRDAAVPLAGVALGRAHRQHGSAAELEGGVGGSGSGQAAMAEARPGADDARADSAHRDVELLCAAPEQSRRDRDAVDIAVEAGVDRDRDGNESA